MALSTNNRKIVSFYQQNKHLNFETVNLTFIDFIEKMSLHKLDISSFGDILQKFQNQELFFDKLSNEINSINEINKLSREKGETEILNIKEKLSNVSSDILLNMTNKMNEFKESYMKHISDELSKTINENQHKIIIDNLNDNFHKQENTIIDKTKNLLNDTINTGLTNMVNNSQLPIMQSINDSEKRINENLKSLNETSIQNKSISDDIKQEITEHLTSLSNSSKKGKIGENKLFSLLTNLYPSGEIINNTDFEKRSGDFFLKRKNKSHIIFENKDYSTNVGPSEIDKFIRDIDTQNSHGIFLSQQTGITLKENYEIDIHKNKILIYLHNVQYNPDIIKSAVEIIDTLDTFIKQNDSEDHIISNSDLNEINLEFKRFLQERQECIQYIQDSHKKMTSMLQKLNLNFLEKYLSTKFAYVQNSNFVCENCNKSWPTKRALSSHQKACKNKMDESENTICIQTFTN